MATTPLDDRTVPIARESLALARSNGFDPEDTNWMAHLIMADWHADRKNDTDENDPHKLAESYHRRIVHILSGTPSLRMYVKAWYRECRDSGSHDDARLWNSGLRMLRQYHVWHSCNLWIHVGVTQERTAFLKGLVEIIPQNRRFRDAAPFTLNLFRHHAGDVSYPVDFHNPQKIVLCDNGIAAVELAFKSPLGLASGTQLAPLAPWRFYKLRFGDSQEWHVTQHQGQVPYIQTAETFQTPDTAPLVGLTVPVAGMTTCEPIAAPMIQAAAETTSDPEDANASEEMSQ